jgi:hypothetical protein
MNKFHQQTEQEALAPQPSSEDEGRALEVGRLAHLIQQLGGLDVREQSTNFENLEERIRVEAADLESAGLFGPARQLQRLRRELRNVRWAIAVGDAGGSILRQAVSTASQLDEQACVIRSKLQDKSKFLPQTHLSAAVAEIKRDLETIDCQLYNNRLGRALAEETRALAQRERLFVADFLHCKSFGFLRRGVRPVFGNAVSSGVLQDTGVEFSDHEGDLVLEGQLVLAVQGSYAASWNGMGPWRMMKAILNTVNDALGQPLELVQGESRPLRARRERTRLYWVMPRLFKQRLLQLTGPVEKWDIVRAPTVDR